MVTRVTSDIGEPLTHLGGSDIGLTTPVLRTWLLEQTLVKYESNYDFHLHLWKCRLQNAGHFTSASVC